MQTEEGRQIYARRSQIAEFAHAWIKERCGLRQFRCRGRLKTTHLCSLSQWPQAALAARGAGRTSALS
jgi:DDE family transposase